jgi:lysophospholipase L1-like esterase
MRLRSLLLAVVALAGVLTGGCGSRADPGTTETGHAGQADGVADGDVDVASGGGSAASGDDPTPTVVPALAGAGDAVLFLGDSLTVGAADIGALRVRLRRVGFEEVDVVAEEGRDPTWGLQQVEALDAVPPLVVVELGTNRSASPIGFAEVVDEIVVALRDRGAQRIAWVTPVYATDDRYRDKADLLEAAPGIDLVATWDEVVHADPTIVGTDGLHPTEAGYTRLARFYAATAVGLASG